MPSKSHFEPRGFKTDSKHIFVCCAPMVLLMVLRCQMLQLYCKRFAQSAGPLFRQCGQGSFSGMDHIGASARISSHEFPITFGIIFGHLGSLWDSFWLPWDHFGLTLGTHSAFQNGLGRPRCPKRHHPLKSSPFWTPLWCQKS